MKRRIWRTLWTACPGEDERLKRVHLTEWRARVLTVIGGLGVVLAGQSAEVSGTGDPGLRPIETSDLVRLQNGDLLYGQLVRLDPTNGMVWARTDLDSPITFRPGSPAEIQLGEGTGGEVSEARSNARLLMTNGDEMRGTLLAADEKSVRIDTSFGGPLVLQRSYVRAIIPTLDPGPPVFTGPQGIEGWTRSEVESIVENAGQWSYRNGAFYADEAASIAKDLQLPDVASVQFDLAWKGTLHIAVALYTDYLHPIKLNSKETEPKFGAFYSLQLNNYYANLLPVKQNEPLRYLGQAGVPALGRKRSVHVEVLASKPKRSVALLIDGTFVKEWSDTNFSGEGTGVRLVHQGQGSVKLSNLVVREWNGLYEEKPSLPSGGAEDMLKTQSGLTLLGRAEVIDGEGLFFQTRAGERKRFPLDEVRQLELAWAPASERPASASARAFFRRGGHLTFELERWDEAGIVARSSAFGRATLNPTAFERIEFQPEGIGPSSSG